MTDNLDKAGSWERWSEYVIQAIDSLKKSIDKVADKIDANNRLLEDKYDHKISGIYKELNELKKDISNDRVVIGKLSSEIKIWAGIIAAIVTAIVGAVMHWLRL